MQTKLAMFLNRIRRKGRSSKVGGTLTCPDCGSRKLRFLRREGRDIDVYVCRNRITEPANGDSWICMTEIRYMVEPFDPMGHGMAEQEARQDAHKGLHRKERAQLDKVKRARKRGVNWMPGLGRLGRWSDKSNRKPKSSDSSE